MRGAEAAWRRWRWNVGRPDRWLTHDDPRYAGQTLVHLGDVEELIIDGTTYQRSLRWDMGEALLCATESGELALLGVDLRTTPAQRAPVIGSIVSITYVVRKGRDPLTSYVHAFGEPRPVLAMDDAGRASIIGGGYRIESRGIVG